MNDARENRKQPLVVHIDGGEAVKPFGLKMRLLIRSEQTGGDFSAIACIHEPGEGPILHMHDHQDEYFFVIEGTYELTVDDKPPVLVGPGSMIYAPAGTRHGFKNVGDQPARMIDWSLPGGQDHYFKEISDLQAGAGFTGGEMNAVNERHHTTYFRRG